MSEATEGGSFFLSAYGRWQLRRIRRAYSNVSGWHSPIRGYEGFVEELQWGLENLPPKVQARAVHAILVTAFMGHIPVAVLTVVSGFFPRPMARIVTWITPAAFSYLVGPVVRTGGDALDIPKCRFVEEGGDRICLEVCQAPTQAFFERVNVPLAMEPNLETFDCRWRYGRERIRREDP